jgi:pilus assembly protein Flp/PilA
MGASLMLSTFIKKLVADQSGATAIEYGLIVSLIVIVMFVSLQSVATTTIEMWTRIQSESATAMGG